MEAEPADAEGCLYLLHARHFAQTIPLTPQENPVREMSLSHLTEARLRASNPTASEKQSWDLNPGLPTSESGPCLYLSCPCLFLGMGRERSQATRPSVLQAGSMRALVLPPCRQSRGRQKDKSARVGTTARGRRGAGRPVG